jgi:hypothetical protein
VLDSVYRVNADGTLASSETRGVDYMKAAVEERYSAKGNTHSWKNSAEDEQREVAGPVFYLSLESTPEESVLMVRAALKAKGQRLALLPSGEVQVSAVGAALNVKGKAGSQRVQLYAMTGLSLTPSYVWLDDKQRFFASVSPWSKLVREGFEETTDQLDAAQKLEERRLAEARAKSLTTKLDRPLAITHARAASRRWAPRRRWRCPRGRGRSMPRAASSCRACGTCTCTSCQGPVAHWRWRAA